MNSAYRPASTPEPVTIILIAEKEGDAEDTRRKLLGVRDMLSTVAAPTTTPKSLVLSPLHAMLMMCCWVRLMCL